MDLLSSLPEEQGHLFIQQAADIEHMSCVTDASKESFFIEHLLNIYSSYKYNLNPTEST